MGWMEKQTVRRHHAAHAQSPPAVYFHWRSPSNSNSRIGMVFSQPHRNFEYLSRKDRAKDRLLDGHSPV